MSIEKVRDAARHIPWQPAPLLSCLVLALALATEPVFQPGVFDDYSVEQVVEAVSKNFGTNLAVGLALLASIAWTRRRPVASPWVESARLLAAVWVSIALANLAVAVASYGLTSLIWLPFAAGETVRWAVLGSFLALVDAFRRRRLQACEREREMVMAQAALQAQTELAQMQLLEAQIEPHFLFNTIANLRRTWTTDPLLGLRMHDNLLHYLRAALPQMRAAEGSLGDEAALVRAYLELFSLRMGSRLAFAIDVPEALAAHAFPRMMLITLVENAIKHGLMPSESGGTVHVDARAEGGQLCVSVTDDGVGFGAADTGGTGVGLANIRARLTTAYAGKARLVVESGNLAPTPSGVRVSLCIPLAAPPLQGAPAAVSQPPTQDRASVLDAHAVEHA